MLTTFSGTVGGQVRQVLLYHNWRVNVKENTTIGELTLKKIPQLAS